MLSAVITSPIFKTFCIFSCLFFPFGISLFICISVAILSPMYFSRFFLLHGTSSTISTISKRLFCVSSPNTFKKSDNNIFTFLLKRKYNIFFALTIISTQVPFEGTILHT